MYTESRVTADLIEMCNAKKDELELKTKHRPTLHFLAVCICVLCAIRLESTYSNPNGAFRVRY